MLAELDRSLTERHALEVERLRIKAAERIAADDLSITIYNISKQALKDCGIHKRDALKAIFGFVGSTLDEWEHPDLRFEDMWNYWELEKSVDLGETEPYSITVRGFGSSNPLEVRRSFIYVPTQPPFEARASGGFIWDSVYNERVSLFRAQSYRKLIDKIYPQS